MSEKKMLQGIASILEETLPEDWSKVVFYAEYAEGAFSIEYYVAGSGKDDFVKCFDQKGVSRASLMKNFMAINKFIEPERAALKPEKRWGSMTLILHSNGKFKVDYDYSDMTENAYARKKAWKKEISRLATNGLGNHRKATRAYSSSARVVGNVSTSAFLGAMQTPVQHSSGVIALYDEWDSPSGNPIFCCRRRPV